MTEVFAALLGALLGGLFTTQQMRGELDRSSGWRDKLFDAAAAEEITIKEIQTLRTALRYNISKKRPVLFSFDWLTDFTIKFCEQLIDDFHRTVHTYSEAETDTITIENSMWTTATGNNMTSISSNIQTDTSPIKLQVKYDAIFRILCRAVLKNHWEFNSAMVPGGLPNKFSHNRQQQEFIKDAFEQSCNIDSRLCYYILDDLDKHYEHRRTHNEH